MRMRMTCKYWPRSDKIRFSDYGPVQEHKHDDGNDSVVCDLDYDDGDGDNLFLTRGKCKEHQCL